MPRVTSGKPRSLNVSDFVVELIASFPQRKSLSLGPEGKSPVWRARTCPDSASPLGQKGSQLGQTRAGLDSLVQYIPFCRVKGKLDDQGVCPYTKRPPAESWRVQKLSADLTADRKRKRLKAGGLKPQAKRPSGGLKPPIGKSIVPVCRSVRERSRSYRREL